MGYSRGDGKHVNCFTRTFHAVSEIQIVDTLRSLESLATTGVRGDWLKFNRTLLDVHADAKQQRLLIHLDSPASESVGGCLAIDVE